MLNSSRHKNTQTKISKDVERFDFIESLSFVGLEAGGTYALQNSIKENILSIPNVTVIDTSPKTVFFNYNIPKSSNYTFDTSTTAGKLDDVNNSISRQKSAESVTSFFSNFVNGDTFVLTESSYNYEQYNLNGTYTFIRFKDNIVVATISSLTTSNAQLFYNYMFDAIPTFTSSNTKVITLDKNIFRITNKIPSSNNSFSTSQVERNSLLEVGDEKYRVTDILLEADREIVTISAIELNSVLLLTAPTLSLTVPNIINHYRQK